jgi:ubiquinol-cytochrome c reductase cytochrome c1 subunit
MSASEYDEAVADLVSFLVWMGEPVAGKRKMIGIFVVIFLAGFYVLTHKLGKTYWKNIH